MILNWLISYHTREVSVHNNRTFRPSGRGLPRHFNREHMETEGGVKRRQKCIDPAAISLRRQSPRTSYHMTWEEILNHLLTFTQN